MAPNRLSQAWHRITLAARAVCAQTNQPFPEALSTQRGDVYARQVIKLEAVADLLEAVAGEASAKQPAAKAKATSAKPAAETRISEPAAPESETPAKGSK